MKLNLSKREIFESINRLDAKEIESLRLVLVQKGVLVENVNAFFVENKEKLTPLIELLDPNSLMVIEASIAVNEVFSPSDQLIDRWGALIKGQLEGTSNLSTDDINLLGRWITTGMFNRNPNRAIFAVVGALSELTKSEYNNDSDEDDSCDCDGESCERCS